MTNYSRFYQWNYTNLEHKPVMDCAYILFCQQSKVSILSCD